jgi:hypothetical protein
MRRVRNGWQNTINSTNAAISKQQKIAPQIFGPHSSEPNTNGFQDHLSLPTGGGKYGLELGSFCPEPAGNNFAYTTKFVELALGSIKRLDHE